MAQCWKTLSFSFGLQNDQQRKEYYLKKSWNSYLSLWREAVRYYIVVASAVKTEMVVPTVETKLTHSSELRLLYRLMKKVGDPQVGAMKAFHLQLARFDIFSLKLLKRAASVRIKLCEAYAVLRQRRRLLRENGRLIKENAG